MKFMEIYVQVWKLAHLKLEIIMMKDVNFIENNLNVDGDETCLTSSRRKKLKSVDSEIFVVMFTCANLHFHSSRCPCVLYI